MFDANLFQEESKNISETLIFGSVKRISKKKLVFQFQRGKGIGFTANLIALTLVVTLLRPWTTIITSAWRL